MAFYTVILMRPDWATNFPYDTFMESVEAISPEEALDRVRQLAVEADSEEDFHPLGSDYFCIVLIAGQHNDINPE